ncbi:retrovirus-related pol polyprotein from transposon TNT 1-94 [Tanacetum coccineum]
MYDQPPGFEDPNFPDRVYKVKKALYGLHQAPKAWYETLSTYLLDNGFQRGKIDKTLFIKRHKEVKTASTPMETQKPLLKDEDGEEVDVLKSQPKFRSFGTPKDSPFDLVAYTDSDYAGASLDRKSIRGVFLNAQPIRYALTVNPTIYISCIEQFWSTGVVKTINGEVQLHALVDRKKIIIFEASVSRYLKLEDEEGIDCLPNSTIFEQLALMGSKTTAWNEFSSTNGYLHCQYGVQIDSLTFSNTIYETMA